MYFFLPSCVYKFKLRIYIIFFRYFAFLDFDNNKKTKPGRTKKTKKFKEMEVKMIEDDPFDHTLIGYILVVIGNIFMQNFEKFTINLFDLI